LLPPPPPRPPAAPPPPLDRPRPARRAGRGGPAGVLPPALESPPLATPLPPLLQPLRHGAARARPGVLPLRAGLGRRPHPGAGRVCPHRSPQPHQPVPRV